MQERKKKWGTMGAVMVTKVERLVLVIKVAITEHWGLCMELDRFLER